MWGLATYGCRASRPRNQIVASRLLAILYLQGPIVLPSSCSPVRWLRLEIMISVLSVTVDWNNSRIFVNSGKKNRYTLGPVRLVLISAEAGLGN